MRSIDACQNGEWSILSWNKADGSDPTARPFRCKSWRHEGECQRYVGALDYVRVKTALLRRPDWTYFVLTYPARDWPDVTELFRFGVIHWGRFLKRLQREYGKLEYIQTWEVHDSGYPHVNCVIGNEQLCYEAAHQGYYLKSEVLEPMADDVGFGFVRRVHPMNDSHLISKYLTKLSKELVGAHVKQQVPLNAPPHFRRIRASRGTLPKREKNEERTGCLCRVPVGRLVKALEGGGKAGS